MSAADKREDLEAQIWRSWPRATQIHIAAILTAADTYAEAVADERIAGRIADRSHGRERLEAAVAETYGRTTS